MATSGYVVDPFSGRPEYDVILEVWRYDQDPWSTRWSWRLTARRFSGYLSWTGNQGPWSVNVEGDTWSGTHSLDFRNTNSIVIASGTTWWKNHNSAGYLTVNFSFSFTNDFFGTAANSSSFAANRIPQEPSTPAPVTFKSATPNSLAFTTGFSADNGGSAIIDYTFRVEDMAGNYVTSWTSPASNQSTPAILDPYTQYRIQHRARNAVGSSGYSSFVTMRTAAGKPTAPLNPVANDLAPTSLTLEWDAPASDGGVAITQYTVQRARDAAFSVDSTTFTTGTARELDFTNLEPSTPYFFRVAATNSAGIGPWSATVEVMTVSGAYYSNGSSWLPAGVFRSDGANWVPVELAVSNGTSWLEAR